MSSIDMLFEKHSTKTQIRNHQIGEDETKKIPIFIYMGIFLVVLFESYVCIKGSESWDAFGFTGIAAYVLSSNTEYWLMFFSTKTEKKAQLLKYILLLFSISTLSFRTYLNDENVKEKINYIKSEKSIIEQQISIELSRGETQVSGLLGIEEDRKVYRKYEKVSKGDRRLGKREERINQTIKDSEEKMEKLLERKREIHMKAVNHNIISNISILSDNTWLSIIGISLMQICVCIGLPFLIDGLRKKKES